MADLESKLIKDETIVFQTKKHWWALIRTSVIAGLLVIASLVLAWLQPDESSGLMGFISNVIGLIRAGLFIGGIGWIVYNFIDWGTARYAVTNMRVLTHEGLLRSRESDTLLSSVSDVRTQTPAVGRMLGFGNIQIMTASGDAGEDSFTSVRQVEQLKKNMLEQKAAAAKAGSASGAKPAPAGAAAPAGSAAAAAAAPDPMATLNGLAKLRDSGAITPEEYEAKKAELLARM